MSDIDPITGLPKELGVWEDLAKESQEISAKIIKKKFGKEYTVVEGIDNKEVNIKEITKKLKNKFACGGTVKGNVIELQGNHLGKVKAALSNLGFPETSLNIRN